MPARDTLPASGWLPVDALDDLENRRDIASREGADRLVALPPRLRVLDLMRLAAGTEDEAKLRAVDLRRVLDSFEGPEAPSAEELAAMFPDLLAG
jgi:hypothetical protein